MVRCQDRLQKPSLVRRAKRSLAYIPRLRFGGADLIDYQRQRRPQRGNLSTNGSQAKPAATVDLSTMKLAACRNVRPHKPQPTSATTTVSLRSVCCFSWERAPGQVPAVPFENRRLQVRTALQRRKRRPKLRRELMPTRKPDHASWTPPLSIAGSQKFGSNGGENSLAPTPLVAAPVFCFYCLGLTIACGTHSS